METVRTYRRRSLPATRPLQHRSPWHCARGFLFAESFVGNSGTGELEDRIPKFLPIDEKLAHALYNREMKAIVTAAAAGRRALVELVRVSGFDHFP